MVNREDEAHAEAERRHPSNHTVDDPFGATGKENSMREDYDVSDGPEGDDEVLDASFRQELTSLINRYSKEQASGTPDFILAEYLMQQLEVWDKSVIARSVWRGEMRSLPAIHDITENGGHD